MVRRLLPALAISVAFHAALWGVSPSRPADRPKGRLVEVEVLGSWGLSEGDEAAGSEGGKGPGEPNGAGLQASGADGPVPAAPTGADGRIPLPSARDPEGALSQGEPERSSPGSESELVQRPATAPPGTDEPDAGPLEDHGRPADPTQPDRLALGPEAADRENDPEGPVAAGAIDREAHLAQGVARGRNPATASDGGATRDVETAGGDGNGSDAGPGSGLAPARGAGTGSGAGRGTYVAAARGAGGGTGTGSSSENAHGALLAHLRSHAQRCYPRAARNRRTQGVVDVSFCVDDAGRPADETVVHTSGSPLLDRVAIDCVIRGSAPLPAPASCYTVPIRFFTR